MQRGHIVWHELAAYDASSAARFYAEVIGLGIEPVPDFDYTLLTAGTVGVAGIVARPDHLRARNHPPRWAAYVAVDDVDAHTEAACAAGATLRYGPETIEGVGRFSKLSDPDNLPFCLYAPDGGPLIEAPPMTEGRIGWNELAAADPAAAWTFYAAQFGWEKSTAIDMGPAGTYQTFTYNHLNGQAVAQPDGTAEPNPQPGAIMPADDDHPPQWLFYFVVAALDPAIARLHASGGTLERGPHPIPGGAWAAVARDPEGARFAVLAARR